MDRDKFNQIIEFINGLTWRDYSDDFESIIRAIKEQAQLSYEDMLDFKGFSKCDSMNKNEIGFLKDYDCPICKNRGYNSFHELKNGKLYYFAKKCECIKIRNEYTRLERSGMTRNTLERYTFDKFNTDETYESFMKSKALQYLEEFKKDKKGFKKWFVVSGITGCGKSHLCTAVYIELLKAGKTVKYMVWKEAIDKLKQNKKSYSQDGQKKYEDEMNLLKTVDVLYVDDLFKLLPTTNYEREAELDIAFSIVNARYQNGLITIISTEESMDFIAEVDMALCGRIKEMVGNYWLQIRAEPNRNHRMQ